MDFERLKIEADKERIFQDQFSQLTSRFDAVYETMQGHPVANPRQLIDGERHFSGAKLLSDDEITSLRAIDPSLFDEWVTGDCQPGAVPAIYVEVFRKQQGEETAIHASSHLTLAFPETASDGQGYSIGGADPWLAYYEQIGTTDSITFINTPDTYANAWALAYGGEDTATMPPRFFLQFDTAEEQFASMHAALDIVQQTPTELPDRGQQGT